jgi:nucleotide-binding universal stress UspA family protein
MSEYTVVVGVSETSGSPTALRWAVTQAAHFGGRVIAVRAWRLPPATASRRPGASELAHDPETVATAARQRLEDDVDRVLGPGHDVEIRLVEGSRRKVLVAQSADTDLLVVDAPRTTDVTGQTLARKLVLHARCPVVVMPRPVPEESQEPPSPRLRSVEGGAPDSSG